MWIRKLHRMGTSVVLTVPRDVNRRWEARQIQYVEIEYQGDVLIVRPLPMEQLLHRPIPEEEDLG